MGGGDAALCVSVCVRAEGRRGSRDEGKVAPVMHTPILKLARVGTHAKHDGIVLVILAVPKHAQETRCHHAADGECGDNNCRDIRAQGDRREREVVRQGVGRVDDDGGDRASLLAPPRLLKEGAV